MNLFQMISTLLIATHPLIHNKMSFGFFVRDPLPMHSREIRDSVAIHALGKFHRHAIKPTYQSWISYQNEFYPEDPINEDTILLEEKSNPFSRIKKVEEKDLFDRIIYIGEQKIDSSGTTWTSIYAPIYAPDSNTPSEEVLKGTIKKGPSLGRKISLLEIYNINNELIAEGTLDQSLKNQSKIILRPPHQNGLKARATVILFQLPRSEGGGWEIVHSDQMGFELDFTFLRFLATFQDIPQSAWTRFKMNRALVVATASAALGTSVTYFGGNALTLLIELAKLLSNPTILLHKIGIVVGETVTEEILETSDGLLEGTFNGVQNYMNQTPWHRQMPMWMGIGAGIWHMIHRIVLNR